MPVSNKVAINVALRPIRSPMTENRGPDRPPDKANEKDAERLQHTHQRVGLREKERAKNQRTYGAVKQKVIPLDRGSDRARYQRAAQLSAMFVVGHGCDGICGDCHLKPSPLVLRFRAAFAHVPHTSSPFKGDFSPR